MCNRPTNHNLYSKYRKSGKQTDSDQNSDWHHMFTIDQSATPSPPTNESVGIGNSPLSSAAHMPATPSSSLVEYSMPERSFLQEKTSQCRKELEALQKRIKMRHQQMSSAQDYDSSMYVKDLTPNWRLKGTLVAHLHEHKSAVTKLANLKSNGNFFVSGSTDGTVRLWDCNKLDGYQSINRSRQIYSANIPIHSMAACDSGQSLAVADKDGTILLLRIDPNSSKMALQEAKHLDKPSLSGGTDYGSVVDMQPLDQGNQSLIVYATLYGAIVCWDLRMPTNAWQLQSDLTHGVITSFCVDPTSSWMATGTSGGKHICWDLRFRLSIGKKLVHFRRFECHPKLDS